MDQSISLLIYVLFRSKELQMRRVAVFPNISLKLLQAAIAFAFR